MRALHPAIRLVSWRCGEAKWLGLLRPTDVSEMYAVAIRFRIGRVPRVYVTAPPLARLSDAEVPHRYSDGSLCLHLPKEWDAAMLVAETTVPWATLWLYYYELWHATGDWLGGGAHPRLRPRVARRAARFAGVQ